MEITEKSRREEGEKKERRSIIDLFFSLAYLRVLRGWSFFSPVAFVAALREVKRR
jgi:hypothetical protein